MLRVGRKFVRKELVNVQLIDVRSYINVNRPRHSTTYKLDNLSVKLAQRSPTEMLNREQWKRISYN
ncbi:hypothetical protein BLOT_000153 [Blomia tropicalis]|nr:hypothetical protein BLOT_000153 [Blomia tropicalis]